MSYSKRVVPSRIILIPSNNPFLPFSHNLLFNFLFAVSGVVTLCSDVNSP